MRVETLLFKCFNAAIWTQSRAVKCSKNIGFTVLGQNIVCFPWEILIGGQDQFGRLCPPKFERQSFHFEGDQYCSKRVVRWTLRSGREMSSIFYFEMRRRPESGLVGNIGVGRLVAGRTSASLILSALIVGIADHNIGDRAHCWSSVSQNIENADCSIADLGYKCWSWHRWSWSLQNIVIHCWS